MNTRRKFLMQGSLATTALLITDPLKSLAATLSPANGFGTSENKVVLLHTAAHGNRNTRLAAEAINKVKKNTGNLVLFQDGERNDLTFPLAGNVYSVHSDDIDNGQYKIIYKGDIKIGVVHAGADDKDVVNRTNKLCARLKEEQQCDLVVCLSKLGYKNSYKADDRKLAENSLHLDIIISNHPENFSKHAFIAENSKKEEVIIHSAADAGFALGCIEISFDKNRKKQSVGLNNLLTRIA